MIIHIEKKVMGSLSHNMGDSVLAYTPGVSPAAGNLASILGENARADSASLYMFTHPQTGLLTMAHVQGAFTTFAGHGRSYPIRAVYEIAPAFLYNNWCSLSTIVNSLDGIRLYDTAEFGCQADIPAPDNVVETLNNDETRLLQYITYCLVHRRQMFIRLGDDERLFGDQLRQSPRLHSILRAISQLPPAIRSYVSMAYSVESNDRGIQALFNNMLIVCHHDDISLWGNANRDGILIDWTAPNLRSINARRASDTDTQRLYEVTPMLQAFAGGQPLTLDSILTLITSIPSNIDRVLHKTTLDNNDKMILSTALSCGQGTYRYNEVAQRLNTPDAPPKKKKEKKGNDNNDRGDQQATIDRRWVERHGRKLIFGIIAIAGVLLGATILKQHTALGKSAAADVYIPSDDEGFVGRTNEMLAHMVQRGNTTPYDTIHPRSITDLQRKYPGLKFTLPYDIDNVEGARAADIRLSDIDPSAIEDNDDVRFFHNSDVPSLLAKQRQSLGENIFRISFSGKDLTIKSIQLTPSMFKVALESNPWTGTIIAADGSLFPSSSHCFMSWGRSVVPIKESGKGHIQTGGGFTKVIMPDIDNNELTLSNGKPIDFYRLYDAYKKDTTTVVLKLGSGREVAFDYLKGNQLCIKPIKAYCEAYNTEKSTEPIRPQTASESGIIYALDQSIKLVVFAEKGREKVAELTIHRNNPMLTLSTLVNSYEGKSRYSISPNLTDRFTQQIVRGLSSTLRNTASTDTIRLSIDPMLSMEMERELRDYCKKTLQPKFGTGEWEMSLTMMDMSTGCIVGAPYYRSADEGIDYDLALGRKNPALMRRYLGSTFKPLVALASVLTKPELASHQNTQGNYRLISVENVGKKTKGSAEFYGHNTNAWALSTSYQRFWNGCETIAEFFAKSDDVYPVAMVTKALGLDEPGSPFKFTKKDILLEENSSFTWPTCQFIQKLDKLYSLPTMAEYSANADLNMTYYTWDALKLNTEDKFGLDNISPDPTLLYFDNLTTPGATLKGELVPWVLGQGTNEWNCLKIAEAWTRMLTKRKVMTSFIRHDSKWEAPLLSESENERAWNTLLNALRDAQNNSNYGLLWPMNNKIVKLCEAEHLTGDDELILFSKTGTPDNYERQEVKLINGKTKTLDMGLFCMALMTRSSFNAALYGGKPKGLMCVIRVTRMLDGKVEGNGVQSTDARNFFSAEQSAPRLKKFYYLTKGYY